MNRTTLTCFTSALLILTACIYTHRAEKTTFHHRTPDLFSQLDIQTQNGAVTVNSTAETIATVKITCYAYGKDQNDAQKRLEKITVTDTVDAGKWQLKANFPPDGVPQGATVDAQLPAVTRTTITTSNNKVTVSGITGGVSITTSNSPVTLIGTAGNATISNRNGPAIVQVHSGAITINTTAAPIDCDLADLPPTASATMTTTNGKVTVLLPSTVSATITATTTNGTVVVTGYQLHYEEQKQNRIRAKIGSGASQITITTTNADILIRNRQATGNSQKINNP